MELNPSWDDDCQSAYQTKNNLRFSVTPDVHYRVNNPPTVSILSQFKPAQSSQPLWFNLNRIIPSMRMSPKWSVFFRFYDWNFKCFLIFSMRGTCPARLTLLDFMTAIIFGEYYTLWNGITKFSPSCCSFLSLRPKYTLRCAASNPPLNEIYRFSRFCQRPLKQ
jgi:hypothetical protein